MSNGSVLRPTGSPEGDQDASAIRGFYQTLIDTRNFEISLFWQRSNYFLVLNTGIAFGFFNLKESRYVWAMAVIGLLASFLWFWVCLGSKHWQARWEQRLRDFEHEHFPSLEFFSASRERIREDVSQGLGFFTLKWPKRSIYKLALYKPSVSFSMILLAALFVLGWVVLIVMLSFLGNRITLKAGAGPSARFTHVDVAGPAPYVFFDQETKQMCWAGSESANGKAVTVTVKVHDDWAETQMPVCKNLK
jgi:hypothetical protein